jgi:hypothetical protein
MKLATLFSFVLFTSLVQARVCTTSESLTCGMAPICTSGYTIYCSDNTSKSFSGITGPLGWGKGAYPKVKKWAAAEGLNEKQLPKGKIFLYDNSERPDARYCISQLITSEKTGIDGTIELHTIYVTCLSDSAKSKIYKLVTKEEVAAELENSGYKNITKDKTAKTQYYRYAAD